MRNWPQERPARDIEARMAMPDVDCMAALPGFAETQAANDTRLSRLARTIEHEIIPRLMLAHRPVAEALLQPGRRDHAIAPIDVERFARLVLSPDEDSALATVHELCALGVPVEKIYVDLLAPTARLLGTLWEEDRCSFTDVTIGLGRLQRVLRELSPALGRGVAHPAGGRRVLLVPAPGEQHTFGLTMVGEFFRLAGWHVTGSSGADRTDAVTLAGAEWFDAIGFSLGAEIHVDGLAAAIAAVRRTSRNREIRVLVGGPLFGANPALVQAVGADAMTIDGREAPALAESLIAGTLSAEVLPG